MGEATGTFGGGAPAGKGRQETRALAAAALFAIVGCNAAPAMGLDIEGRAVDPLAGSDVVALVFVTTECPISNRYAPTLERLAARWQGDPVKFFAVYPDPEDDAAAVQQHRREFGMSFAAIRDPKHDLVGAAKVRVTPEAAVYKDRAQVYRGRIDDRAVDFGTFRPASTQDDLADAVARTLGGDAVELPSTNAIGCAIADLKARP